MRAHWIAVIATATALAAVVLFAPEWGYTVLLSLDQHVNAILGGDPDETLSSRLGKWMRSGSEAKRFVADTICWFLDLFERDHCVKSIDPTEGAK